MKEVRQMFKIAKVSKGWPVVVGLIMVGISFIIFLSASIVPDAVESWVLLIIFTVTPVLIGAGSFFAGIMMELEGWQRVFVIFVAITLSTFLVPLVATYSIDPAIYLPSENFDKFFSNWLMCSFFGSLLPPLFLWGFSKY
jgi:hypothetical protein